MRNWWIAQIDKMRTTTVLIHWFYKYRSPKIIRCLTRLFDYLMWPKNVNNISSYSLWSKHRRLASEEPNMPTAPPMQWWAKSNSDSIQSQFESQRRFDSNFARFDSSTMRFDTDSIQILTIRYKRHAIWTEISESEVMVEIEYTFSLLTTQSDLIFKCLVLHITDVCPQ